MSRKMSKDIVPEGFTLGMVLQDMLPVVFFGATTIVIGLILKNFWIGLGAMIAFVSGLLKVLWKLIVVTQKKNVWPLFLQMRIAMPIGFGMFVIALVVSLIKCPFAGVLAALTGFPQCIFFLMGVLGMILMIVFAARLDSADAKSNWLEQTTNTIAQASFLIGVLIIYFGK